MANLGICNLIYIARALRKDGSPYDEIINKSNIKCTILETFSVYYYKNDNRDMRDALNIEIPNAYTYDIEEENLKFRLMFIEISGTKYQVKNILKNNKSSMTKILDLQEVKSI